MANPLLPKNGVFRLSAHKLNLQKECPFKCFLYLMRYPGTETDNSYAVTGSAVHDFAEEITKGCAQDPSFYLGKWKVPQTTPDGIDLHNRFYTCVENVKRLATMPGAIPEQTEYTEFTTPKGRKVRLETRIDLQCENSNMPEAKGKVVWDYKTGSNVNKDEYILQAKAYQFAKYMKTGEVYKACFISLLDPTKYFVLDKFNVEYIPKVCDEYIDALYMHEFDRHPSYLCRWCPYHDLYCAKEVCFDELPDPPESDKIEE